MAAQNRRAARLACEQRLADAASPVFGVHIARVDLDGGGLRGHIVGQASGSRSVARGPEAQPSRVMTTGFGDEVDDARTALSQQILTVLGVRGGLGEHMVGNDSTITRTPACRPDRGDRATVAG